jgi:hypothetical protein
MADENKGAAAGQDASADASTGQPDPATQGEGNVEGLVAKNKELLGELKKWQAKAKAAESKADKETEAKLKEDGKLKELLDKKEAELSARTDRVRRAELKAAALKYDLLDDEYIDVLMKRVEFDENDTPQNLDDVFKELREKKPFLFKQDAKEIPGTANKGASGWKPGGKHFTVSEINAMTPDERDKNWLEIQRQMGAGLIK